jgi:hypothetical protein
MPLLPSHKHVVLIGIHQAGPSAPPSGFWKGAMREPAVHRSLSDANTGGNVGHAQPLLMQFNNLSGAIHLLRAPPCLCQLDTASARRTPRGVRHGFRPCLLGRDLPLDGSSDFGPAARQEGRDTVR